MEKRFRLTEDEDFRRVRQRGRSWATPLVALYAIRNGLDRTRVGFAAGKRLGKATVRNRIKRRLREIVRSYLPRLAPGWDLVFVARAPSVEATFPQMCAAVSELMKRSGLLTGPPARGDDLTGGLAVHRPNLDNQVR